MLIIMRILYYKHSEYILKHNHSIFLLITVKENTILRIKYLFHWMYSRQLSLRGRFQPMSNFGKFNPSATWQINNLANWSFGELALNKLVIWHIGHLASWRSLLSDSIGECVCAPVIQFRHRQPSSSCIAFLRPHHKSTRNYTEPTAEGDTWPTKMKARRRNEKWRHRKRNSNQRKGISERKGDRGNTDAVALGGTLDVQPDARKWGERLWRRGHVPEEMRLAEETSRWRDSQR